MAKKISVLVIGYRKMLNQALKKMSIPFSVLKNPSDLNEKPLTNFTHVIPAGEGSVVLANQIRKTIGLNIISERTISLCSDKLLMKQQAVHSKISVTSFLPGDTELSSKKIYKH